MNQDVDAFLSVSIAAAAAAVAVALVAPRNAYAESTAEYITTLVSTRSRTDVQAERMGRPELLRTGPSDSAIDRRQGL